MSGSTGAAMDPQNALLLRVVESVDALTEATELLNREMNGIHALRAETGEVHAMFAESAARAAVRVDAQEQ